MEKLVCVTVLLIVTSLTQAQEKGTFIEVEITHIESEEGQMRIGLYDA